MFSGSNAQRRRTTPSRPASAAFLSRVHSLQTVVPAHHCSPHLAALLTPRTATAATPRRSNFRVNGLTGSLPPQWGALVNLKGMWAEGNQLSGELPSSWSQMAKMEALWVPAAGQPACRSRALAAACAACYTAMERTLWWHPPHLSAPAA